MVEFHVTQYLKKGKKKVVIVVGFFVILEFVLRFRHSFYDSGIVWGEGVHSCT